MIDWSMIGTILAIADHIVIIIKLIINHCDVMNTMKRYLAIICLVISIVNNKDNKYIDR